MPPGNILQAPSQPWGHAGSGSGVVTDKALLGKWGVGHRRTNLDSCLALWFSDSEYLGDFFGQW